MKVFPRVIEVAEDEENFVFINNASSTDRLLFFKVKRSDPKVIEFHPRKGVIEAGITSKVKLKIVGGNISNARILIQLVAVTRNMCTGAFETDWAVGSSSGVVNKVVDIHRKVSLHATPRVLSSEPPEVLVDTDSSSIQVMTVDAKPPIGSASEQSRDQTNLLDATESALPLQRLQLGGCLQSNFAEQDLDDALGIDLNTSRTDNISASHSMTETPKLAFDRVSDVSISVLEDNITVEPDVEKPRSFRMEGLIVKNVASGQRHGHGIAYDSWRETLLPAEVEHDTVDTRLLSEIMSRQSMLTGSEQMTKPLNNEDLDMALLAHIERIDGDRREAEVRQSAALNSLSKTRHSVIRGMLPSDYSDMLGAGETYEIEDSDCHVLISGPQATDTVVAGSIETRTGEAMQSRRRIRAISISNSPIVSLASSVCAVFPRKQAVGSPHELAASAMSFLLDSQLHHLSITHAGLQVIEPCIGRFDKLLTLDLSRNQIVRIGGQIELPCLLSLDLSNNMLSSVDFLQNLRCLSSLCLHSNCITSLAESVNTMVPLGRTLKRLDMRRNAVCRDERYAEQTMGVLPHLALFDGRDIEKLREEALRKRSSNRDLSSSRLSRTDSLCNSMATRSDTSMSFSLDQSDSPCPMSDFDRRLRGLLKRRALSRPGPGPSNRSSEEAHRSLQTKRHRPKTDSAVSKRSESTEECKGAENRVPLPDAIMSLSIIRDSPLNAPTQTKSAPAPVLQNSLRNSIASFLSETIENGEDDDRSWIEDAHDYLNLLTNTPPKPAMQTQSPPHSAVLSAGAVRTAQLEVKSKQAAKKAVSSGIAFPVPSPSPILSQISPAKSAKSLDRSKEERAMMAERRKRQQAVAVSLMVPTEGQVQRRKASGLGLSATSSGYESDGSVSRRARRTGRPSFDGNLTADHCIATQSDGRCSKWNPRSRVPTDPYGYSRPFSHHREPTSPNNIPCYAETVERMRRSFELKPNRGTFSKTKRSSNAELEPPHFHYAESRAIIAANRGIGMPFSGLGEEKDIREGARWIKQGVRAGSPSVTESRGRSNLTQSPRTVSTSNSPFRDRGASASAGGGSRLRCHSVDSFSGSKKWYSYGTQDTLQNLWDATLGSARGQRSDFEYPDNGYPGETGRRSSRNQNQDSFEGPDGEDGDGFLESKSDINTPIPGEEVCGERDTTKSLFALAAPSAAVLFDFEEQVRQTAAFEAAAIAALKTTYSVRSSNSYDAASLSLSPPPTLVPSSAASLTSLFAPVGDESVSVSSNRSPTSDRPPDRVMLRRPAVLVPAPSLDPAPARTIQLTAQESVKEDQLNAYLRWLQTQHSASEDLREASPQRDGEPEDLMTDRYSVQLTSPGLLPDDRWTVPGLLADPCHPRVNAMKLEVPPVPSPDWPAYPLRSLFGSPKGSRSSA